MEQMAVRRTKWTQDTNTQFRGEPNGKIARVYFDGNSWCYGIHTHAESVKGEGFASSQAAKRWCTMVAHGWKSVNAPSPDELMEASCPVSIWDKMREFFVFWRPRSAA